MTIPSLSPAAPARRLPLRALTTLLDGNPVAPAGAILVGIWVAWAVLEGGFSPTRWGPLGLGAVLALAISILAARGTIVLRDRWRIVMVAALAAFVAWNYLSMLWAEFPAESWISADKMLIYAAGFAVFALWPWTDRGMLAALGLFSLAIATVGMVALAQIAVASDTDPFFNFGRLIWPSGYENANVALWMLAFWPAVYLGSRHDLPAPLRGLFLGCSGLLLDLALLGQSRAWLVFLPIVAVLYLLLARERLRALLGLALVGVATASILGPLLGVFRAADEGTPFGPAIDRAVVAAAISCLVLAGAGFGWALADQRWSLSERAKRAIALALAAIAVAGIAAGAILAARAIDDPGAWIDARWRDFTRGYSIGEEGDRFTGSLGTDRYAEWRIAWAEFLDHPVIGIGGDNYAAAYLEQRTDNYHEPRYPHSAQLRLLSQFGILGTGIFLAFLVPAIVLALRRRRRSSAAGGTAVAACLMVFAYWFLHGGVDWFWEIPALAGPAFGLLGLACASDAPPQPRAGGRKRASLLAVPVVGAALVSALAVVPLWLSDAYAESASKSWGANPAAAYDRLELAADLNPLSARPLVLEGSIALRLRDLPVARDALGRATEREPRAWYPYVQLALLEAYAGNFTAAEGYVETARELNPRDPVVELVERLVRHRVRVDPERVNDFYARGLNRELSRTAVLENYSDADFALSGD